MSEPDPAVLIPEAEVAARVEALAAEIAPRIDDETVVVCLLTGGLWFASDLTRALARQGRMVGFDALWLASYKDERVSSGRCEVRADLQRPIAGRKALVVDDVFDTGLSLSEAARLVRDSGASEVLTAVFARKPWPTKRAIEPDYVAWEAPGRFLDGYGMDVAGRMRGLPYVGAMDCAASRSGRTTSRASRPGRCWRCTWPA
jgi:hypoxanthine phosphoribosyltransferase